MSASDSAPSPENPIEPEAVSLQPFNFEEELGESDQIYSDLCDLLASSEIDDLQKGILLARQHPTLAIGLLTDTFKDLLSTFDDHAADPDGLERLEEYIDESPCICPGLYFLAESRDTSLFPSIVRLLEFPTDLQERLLGETLLQDGSKILAQTFNGDFANLRRIFFDEKFFYYDRHLAFEAALLAAAWDIAPEGKEIARSWIREMLTHYGDPQNPEPDEDSISLLSFACSDSLTAGFDDLLPLILHLHDLGRINERIYGDKEDAQKILRDSLAAADWKAHVVEHARCGPPITDAFKEIGEWRTGPSSTPQSSSPSLRELIHADHENPGHYEDVPLPYIRPDPKIGRNDPCPCGSGKKYKKCCGK